MQEEIDENRRVIEQLRLKYKQAQNEIKDLDNENEMKNEDLLDTIRE